MIEPCRKYLSVRDMIRTYSQMHRTDKYSQNLASLGKWLSVRLRTKWLWVPVPLHSLKVQISPLI